NSVAGMLNLDLVNKHKLRSALSINFNNVDYGMHYLSGNPNEGQSLEDVKDQLLSVLEKIKSGDFDEGMITACANDIKRDFIKDITENQNLDAACAFSFTKFRSWAQRLAFVDDLQKISKQQLIAFAKKAYQNNYVVVYKKQGPS